MTLARFADQALEPIAAKVAAGERLSREDGLDLLASPDLLGVGMLADEARARIAGSRVYYTTNLNLNPTNACVLRCTFCAFRRDVDDQEAYVVSPEEAVRRSKDPGIKEVHMVGGLHPKLRLGHFEELLSAIKRHRPDVYLQGFTAVEVDFFARLDKLPIEEVLGRLKAAGLDGIPGGGAEVFSPRVRKILCPTKISGERWLEVMEAAHRLGIKTNATILYGHIETPEERVDHLLALRDLQDRTGGFKAFVPLSFQADNTELADRPPTSGYDDLKMYAVSRLLLDNFPHVKALWNYIGLKVAQTALHFGVDDLGGTAMEEQIATAGGARHGMVTREMLERIVRDAGRIPVYSTSGYLPLN